MVLWWEGRTIEAPSRDGAEKVMSVQCEGWQHHPDDDLIDGFTFTDGSLTEGRTRLPRREPDAVYDCRFGGIRRDADRGWCAVPFPPAGANVGVKLDLGPDVPQRRSRSRSKGSPGQRTAGQPFRYGLGDPDYWGVGNAPSISPTLASIGHEPESLPRRLPRPDQGPVRNDRAVCLAASP